MTDATNRLRGAPMPSMAIRRRRRPPAAGGTARRPSALLKAIGPALLLLWPAGGVTEAKDRPKPVGDARAAITGVPTGCEAFGPGFRKVDGLETCVKIGGGVRVESGYIAGAGRALSAEPGPQR